MGVEKVRAGKTIFGYMMQQINLSNGERMQVADVH
jgi:hypothetical protein